jgi:glycosyltransferase involved in cell wall biosynthesis
MRTIKVLAIVYTQGSISVFRPEAEQFIEMQKLGVRVDIMCHKNSPYEQIFKENGLNIVGEFPKSKKDKEAEFAIRKLLIDGEYDILHVLERRSIACGVRAAKNLPVKVVAYRGASGLYWHDPTAYENALNPRVDKVICVCNDIRDNLKKQLFFKKDKAVTIYKGHRLNWYADVEKSDLSDLNIPKDAFILACSANNRKWKGIPTFLDAVGLLPPENNIHILLIGNGMDTRFYKNKIASNKNKERIHVLGFRSDVLGVVKNAHVIMQTSYKNEGLSRSTIEGMSMGLVPIVTNAGGNAELVEDGKCGLVVPVKNARKMADAILKVYKNKELWNCYSNSAIQRIQMHFTVEKTALETIDIYKSIIDS